MLFPTQHFTRSTKKHIFFKNPSNEDIESLHSRYVSEFETRVTSSLANAKIALKSAIDSQDVDGQVNGVQRLNKCQKVPWTDLTTPLNV